MGQFNPLTFIIPLDVWANVINDFRRHWIFLTWHLRKEPTGGIVENEKRKTHQRLVVSAWIDVEIYPTRCNLRAARNSVIIIERHRREWSGLQNTKGCTLHAVQNGCDMLGILLFGGPTTSGKNGACAGGWKCTVISCNPFLAGLLSTTKIF